MGTLVLIVFVVIVGSFVFRKSDGGLGGCLSAVTVVRCVAGNDCAVL
jgi:hypothetical protein